VRNHVASTDRTVLIIEDDEAARSVMERTLADAGYSVVVVTAKDLTAEDRGRLKDEVATIEAKDSDFKVQLLAYVRDRMQPSTAA